jgi:hypothetical protein
VFSWFYFEFSNKSCLRKSPVKVPRGKVNVPTKVVSSLLKVYFYRCFLTLSTCVLKYHVFLHRQLYSSTAINICRVNLFNYVIAFIEKISTEFGGAVRYAIIMYSFRRRQLAHLNATKIYIAKNKKKAKRYVSAQH